MQTVLRPHLLGYCSVLRPGGHYDARNRSIIMHVVRYCTGHLHFFHFFFCFLFVIIRKNTTPSNLTLQHRNNKMAEENTSTAPKEAPQPQEMDERQTQEQPAQNEASSKTLPPQQPQPNSGRCGKCRNCCERFGQYFLLPLVCCPVVYWYVTSRISVRAFLELKTNRNTNVLYCL